MHHYDPVSKQTIFTCSAENGLQVFLWGHFPDSRQERIPMTWRKHHWQAAVELPMGMYAYQFEINGRRVRDESAGSIMLQGPQASKAPWSLAIVPNWIG
ncbi:MAG: hypothetical protein CMJ68_18515 [Planctomycetaceae bacterium]|jgi:hypothetical protein|nr:hypothetical protein [Planctomycetaceae bacterium]|tara:strand:- start:505 stop:801 length:297 start_codon:yes stop_codon:yes gene_type:complete